MFKSIRLHSRTFVSVSLTLTIKLVPTNGEWTSKYRWTVLTVSPLSLLTPNPSLSFLLVNEIQIKIECGHVKVLY